MKLVLKIAAGIIIAWFTIIVSGVIIAGITATAISQTVVKPNMDKLNEAITKPMQPTGFTTTTTYTNVLPFKTEFDCVNNNGRWGFNASTTDPFDFICITK